MASNTKFEKFNQMAREANFPLFLVFCSVYGILNRTLDDFLNYPPKIAFFSILLVYSFLISLWAKGGFRKIKPTLKGLLIFVIAIPIFSVAIAVVYYGMWAVLKDGYELIHRSIPYREFAIGFTVIAVIGAGWLLYFFRRKARFFFGLSEAVAGLVVAVTKIPSDITDPILWHSDTYLIMLTAGVYLVVRGLDNMQIGQTPDSYDEILKYLEEETNKMYERNKAQLHPREPVDVDDEVES
jgi:hypothetical protein